MIHHLKRIQPDNGKTWVSLHDVRITKIKCENNHVIFFFKNGFDLIDNGELIKTKKGAVVMGDCDDSNFSCEIIRGIKTRKGLISIASPITLGELGKMLSKWKALEIYVELYDSNHFYWKADIYSYSKIGLISSEVTIQSMDALPITYYWE